MRLTQAEQIVRIVSRLRKKLTEVYGGDFALIIMAEGLCVAESTSKNGIRGWAIPREEHTK